MLEKIYPADQMEKYLYIDVLAIVFLCYQVYSSDHSLSFLSKTFLLTLFLFSYYICLWKRDWRLLFASLFGYLILGILAFYIHDNILIFNFIFADLLGRTTRKMDIATGMVGMASLFLLYSWWSKGSPWSMIQTIYFPIAIVHLLTPVIVYTRERTKTLEEKLKVTNERLIQEEERHRIASDLHDTLGQTLTMIKLKSELTMRLMDQNQEKAKRELNDILDTSRSALKQVRELVSDMKFVSLEKEIEEAGKLLKTAGIGWKHTKKQVPLLGNVAETMLALSVRELVTNVVKHSEANDCEIVQSIQNERCYIQVCDNGNGQVLEGKGSGIQSIKERMAKIDGKMVIDAVPGQGTTITLQVPIDNRRINKP